MSGFTTGYRTGKGLCVATKTIEVVEWKDAVVDAGWDPKDEVRLECHLCVSIGILVNETPEQVVLAATWSEDNNEFHVNNKIAIPKGWVTNRRTLKL